MDRTESCRHLSHQQNMKHNTEPGKRLPNQQRQSTKMQTAQRRHPFTSCTTLHTKHRAECHKRSQGKNIKKHTSRPQQSNPTATVGGVKSLLLSARRLQASHAREEPSRKTTLKRETKAAGSERSKSAHRAGRDGSSGTKAEGRGRGTGTKKRPKKERDRKELFNQAIDYNVPD